MRVSFFFFFYIFFWHRSISSRTFARFHFSFFLLYIQKHLCTTSHTQREFLWKKNMKFWLNELFLLFSLHLLLVSLDFLVVSNALLGNKRVCSESFCLCTTSHTRRRFSNDSTPHLFPQSINVRLYCHLPSYQLSKQANKNTISSYDAAHAKIVSMVNVTAYLHHIHSHLSLSLLTKLKTLKHAEKKWRT